METKKSTPTKIDFKREWSGDKGTVYYFSIEFANGDKGDFSSNKKDQDKFKLNIETDYTIETKQRGQYTDTIIAKPQTGGGGFKGRPFDIEFEKAKNHAIIRQSSLAAAVNLGVAKGLDVSKSDKILKVAEIFYQWVIKPLNGKL